MNELFEANGFVKVVDDNVVLSIDVTGSHYDFDFETNTINKIPDTDVEFAVAVDDNGHKHFFINKDFNPMHDASITSPYRTFYAGLMKEPFKLVYPLDAPIRIETDSGMILDVQVKEKEL